MTPEERAKAAFEKIKQELGHACACVGPQAGADMCPCASKRHEIIATAIREACNEKLEEAAQRAMETSQAHAEGWRENPSKYGCGGAVAASNTGFFIIQAIRSLKDTTP